MKKIYLIIVGLLLTIGLKAQVEKTIENTAGQLNSLLTDEELNTITDLTIKGTLDARDFRVMRNAMPVLSVLDISGTTILEYSTLYPANTIPGHPYDVPFSESFSLLQKTTLTAVKLPPTVTEIGQDAFYGCTNLVSINFPEGLLSIGRAAFFSCTSLTSVELPSSLTTMGLQVFERCSSLSHVQLPPGIKAIEGGTFSDCTSLVSIDIPSQVTELGEAAFMRCSKLTSVVLPSTLEKIGNYCFKGCTLLSGVHLPLPVIFIGMQAFYECTSLETINIPRKVKTIGAMAFSGCTRLTSIYAFPVQPVQLMPDKVTGVFLNMDLTKCVLYVPEGSRELYAAANQWGDFKTITEMPGIRFSTTSVTINKQGTTVSFDITTQLSWKATSGQSWLTITPSSGTGSQQISIAAQENTSLTTRRDTVVFFISDSIQYEIPVEQKGASLTVELEAPGTFGQQLTSDQLSVLSDLIVTGPMDARDFKFIRDQMPLLEVLDLRGTSIIAYSGSGGTSSLLSSWDYPADELPDFALNKEKNRLTTLYLPETCTSVGREALFYCKSLKQVIFPPSVVNIDFRAFGQCQSLEKVLMPSVKTIGPSAFEGCISLTEIQMPAVTKIDKIAFENCTLLPSVTLPTSLTRIEDRVFSMCFNLRSVELGDSVTEIGPRAFFEDHTLRTINIPSTVTFISGDAFHLCDLHTIYCYLMRPIDLNGAFDEVDKTNCILYVPFGTKVYFETADQWKDFIHIVEMDGFELSVSELTMQADASSQTINITSNTPWSAVSDQDWLTVSPASGDTTQELTVLVLDNGSTERKGVITFTAESGYTQTLQVTQQALENNIPVANAGEDQRVEEGKTVQLDGSASTDADNDPLTYEWTAPEGITLSSVTDARPTFTAPMVVMDIALPFKLVVRDGKEQSVSDRVIVIVTNRIFELEVSLKDTVFDSKESSAKVLISGNAMWTVSSDQDWLSVSPLSGEGEKEITLSAPANETFAERTAIVTVSAPEAEDQTITVTQKGLVTAVDQMAANARIVSYPNPFTSQLVIEIENPSLEEITIEIYSMSGQKIKTLTKALKGANISLLWKGEDEQGKQVPGGMYLVKMNGEVRKVVKE